MTCATPRCATLVVAALACCGIAAAVDPAPPPAAPPSASPDPSPRDTEPPDAPTKANHPTAFQLEVRHLRWAAPEERSRAVATPSPTDSTEPRRPAPRRAQPGEEADAMVLGRLLHGRVDVRSENAPLRSVLSELAQAIGVNIVAFYETSSRPAPLHSVRIDEAINLVLHDVDALTALEAIADQAGLDVTWQLHRGVIELAPRVTLARDGAQRNHVYEIDDLMLAAPQYESGESKHRLRPADVASDLVRMITEQCEPQAFEPEPEPGPGENGASPRKHVAPAAPSANPRTAVNTNATRNLDPDLGPIFVRGRWASVQVKDTLLVVRAPDFVHRAIGGYPAPIPPP